MKLQQVSERLFAVLNGKNRALSIRVAAWVIDTQWDLPHGHRMIEFFDRAWARMPNTRSADQRGHARQERYADAPIRVIELGRCRACTSPPP
jgi:hypothetical protein